MLLTNNSRKMAGVPMRRKMDRRRRFYTRNRSEEAVRELVKWWNRDEVKGSADEN